MDPGFSALGYVTHWRRSVPIFAVQARNMKHKLTFAAATSIHTHPCAHHSIKPRDTLQARRAYLLNSLYGCTLFCALLGLASTFTSGRSFIMLRAYDTYVVGLPSMALHLIAPVCINEQGSRLQVEMCITVDWRANLENAWGVS